MLRYILKRFVSVIIVVILVSVLIFAILKMMPGDQVRLMLPRTLKQEQYKQAYEAMTIKLGLDKSLPEQYWRWLRNMIVDGDFGYSTNYSRPVKDAVKDPMKNTLYLNLFVIILELLIVIPVGIRSATKRLSLFDNAWSVFTLVTYSMPSFFVGLCLVYIFSIKLHLTPISGMPNAQLLQGWAYLGAWFRHAVLPAVTLTIISIAGTFRYVRNAMIDALSQDYIRTARAKGLSEKVVVYSHAFRNALIPVSTVIIATIFGLFIGSPITEKVFGWNGIGKVLVDSLNNRDYMMVITLDIFFAIASILGNFVADIVYGLIDPRIKLE